MTIKSIKSIVRSFAKKHNIINADFCSLKKAAQDLGYTLIEFNAIFNEKDVAVIIQNLNISDAVLKSRGFTYTDSNHRLIFINEDLNNEEKLLVISHEIGHIKCGHFTSAPIIGNDVKEEHEANEFSHYLLKQDFICKWNRFVSKNKKAIKMIIIAAILIVTAVFVGYAVKKENSYYGNYYITSTGNKYHEKDCIFVKDKTSISRLSKVDFESGKYKACEMCLP